MTLSIVHLSSSLIDLSPGHLQDDDEEEEERPDSRQHHRHQDDFKDFTFIYDILSVLCNVWCVIKIMMKRDWDEREKLR